MFAAAPAISMGSTRLVYTPDDLGNNIPDYSYAGYKGGGVTLPTLANRVVLSPIAGDNTAAIQAAINAVAARTADANGFRGAVVLNAGTYEIDGDLTFNASGVVLRGVGPATILKWMGTARTGFVIGGSGGASGTGTTYSFASTYFPCGSKTFSLTATPSFVVGDQIIIHRPWTQTWIDAMGMGTSGPLETEGWTPSSGAAFERTVVAKTGTSFTVDIPLPTPFDPQYAIGTAQKITDTGRIQNAGVENLTVLAAFTDPVLFFAAVTVQNCKNCWVKGVTMDSWGDGVTVISSAKFITTQDCFYKNGYDNGSARPFSYDTDGQMCFFLRDTAVNGFEHIVSTQSSTAGPNAWLDVTCVTAGDFDGGGHQKWALGALYDNVNGPVSNLKIYNAGVEGTGHGWVEGYSMIYNCAVSTVTCQAPPLPYHYNWLYGGKGTISGGTGNPGTYVSTGTIISPRSLYLQQLKERLGTSAVANIGYARFSGNQKIMAQNSSLFVTLAGNSSADNTPVTQITFSTAAADQWQMVDVGSGYYEIKNALTGKALGVSGNSAVEVTYATGGTAAQWQVTDTTGGYAKIINRASGKALEVAGSSTAQNAVLDVAAYSAAANQQFQIVSIP